MADSHSGGALLGVMAILERARRIGESSWRVGIALGVKPRELRRIERELDGSPARAGEAPSTGKRLQ